MFVLETRGVVLGAVGELLGYVVDELLVVHRGQYAAMFEAIPIGASVVELLVVQRNDADVRVDLVHAGLRCHPSCCLGHWLLRAAANDDATAAVTASVVVRLQKWVCGESVTLLRRSKTLKFEPVQNGLQRNAYG